MVAARSDTATSPDSSSCPERDQKSTRNASRNSLSSHIRLSAPVIVVRATVVQDAAEKTVLHGYFPLTRSTTKLGFVSASMMRFSGVTGGTMVVVGSFRALSFALNGAV